MLRSPLCCGGGSGLSFLLVASLGAAIAAFEVRKHDGTAAAVLALRGRGPAANATSSNNGTRLHSVAAVGNASSVGSTTTALAAAAAVDEATGAAEEKSLIEPYQVRKCAGGSEVVSAMKSISRFGTSPYWEKRSGMAYYKHTWCAMKVLGGEKPKTVLDVGSSFPFFLNSVDWVPDRSVVAPYFQFGGGGSDAHNPNDAARAVGGVKLEKADFLTWTPPVKYDLVLCSQVLEHVDQPGPFLQKLISTGKHVVVSIPYNWPYSPNHKWHHLRLSHLLAWAGTGNRPKYTFLVHESSGSYAYRKRLFAIW